MQYNVAYKSLQIAVDYIEYAHKMHKEESEAA